MADPIQIIASQRAAIKDLFKSSDYLTAWEIEFLTSIDKRLAKVYMLSEKQKATLDKLIAQVAERFD